MRRETLLTLGPVVVFIGVPLFLLYTPAGITLQSWPDFALIAASAIVLIVGAIFISIALAKRLFPAGAIRRVQDVERTQVYSAIAYGCLVTALALTTATSYPAVAAFYSAFVLAWALWSIPASARRIEYRLGIVAQCSPDAAFELVSDPRNWHRYLPEIDVFGPIELPLHVGSIVHTTYRQGRWVLSEDEQVIAYEPGRRFGTASVHRRPTDGVYDMARVDAGTDIAWTCWTVLTYCQAVASGPFGRHALRARVVRRRQESLATIKRLLEAPTPVSV